MSRLVVTFPSAPPDDHSLSDVLCFALDDPDSFEAYWLDILYTIPQFEFI